MMRAERVVRRLAQSRIPTGVVKFTGSALSPVEVDRVMDEWRRQPQLIVPAPQVTSFESRRPLLPWHRRRRS